MPTIIIAFVCAVLLITDSAFGDDERTPAPPSAEAYIVTPIDGATIKGPVTIIFGLKGMGVAPAGTDREKTGHHHLLINTPLPDLNDYIPMDENHRHFGGGQTEVVLDLPAGTHTLQLLLGDQNHLPHKPAIYSKKITITVTD